jgi:23S rRNA (adenine2503-C2)-methyltransferase
MIDKLSEERLGITLSVSLHSPFDGVRSSLMLINKTYPVPMLINSLRNYAKTTKRRVSLEYIVIDGVNNREEDVTRLRFLVKGLLCHINLIGVNPVANAQLGDSPSLAKRTMSADDGCFVSADSRAVLAEFAKKLTDAGLNATVRRTTGADIKAACGQLRANAKCEISKRGGINA